MTEGVVDQLETVEVDEQQADMLLLAARLQDRLIEPVLHQPPVGQAGERVMVRHIVDGALGVEPLGDILHQGSHADDIALRVDQGRVVPLGMDDLAALGAVGQRHPRRALRLHQFHPHAGHALAVLGALHQGIGRFADHLGGAEAEDRFGRGVPGRDAEFRVPFHHAQRGALQMQLEPLQGQQFGAFGLASLAGFLFQGPVGGGHPRLLLGQAQGDQHIVEARRQRIAQRLVDLAVHGHQQAHQHQDGGAQQ